uniref:Uncharacterized protein n=1 Tax=Glossina palpalis gambiensis TaxID=67801 RepID=A0A1B0AP76_9MUSC
MYIPTTRDSQAHHTLLPTFADIIFLRKTYTILRKLKTKIYCTTAVNTMYPVLSYVLCVYIRSCFLCHDRLKI